MEVSSEEEDINLDDNLFSHSDDDGDDDGPQADWSWEWDD
jgi:hypothetical protein